jgi:hypothetical protein
MESIRPLINRAGYASAAYLETKEFIIQTSADLIDFRSNPKGKNDERLLELLKMMTVFTVPDHSLMRMGGPNDGGYIMSLPKNSCTAISLGVGPNVSWDKQMVSLGHRVEMFDPTIWRPPVKVAGAKFHRIGVVGNLEGKKNLDLRQLSDLRVLCEPYGRNLILKIDVEGAEWFSFANSTKLELDNYQQILVEFHDLNKISDESRWDLMRKAIANLCDSHFPIHIHANNYSKLIRFGNYWFPDALEVSFLRKTEVSSRNIATSVRSQFDQPNCPELPDWNLEGLIYAWNRK